MYPEWYVRKCEQYSDSFNTKWDIFGITDGALLGKPDTAMWLGRQEIISWLDEKNEAQNNQQNRGLRSFGGIILLLTRHRNQETHEIKPWYLAFKQSIFKEISHKMNLPSAYLYMRNHAGGSGNFARYSTFDDGGLVSRLGFIIRVPHSPRPAKKAVWSLAVSWNCSTGLSTGLFESVSDADIQDITGYLSANSAQSHHPLSLLTMILDLLVIFYVAHRRELETSLFVLEKQLGITRGLRTTDAWDWDYELYRETTKHCNTVYTGLVYLERRLEFVVGLCQFLLDCLNYCQDENVFPPEHRSGLLAVSKSLRERIQNDNYFASSQLQQVLCLQKRSQALTSVIYIIIAQKDSRTNVKIAKAAKSDSSSMTAIAILGIVFLPAMLVASMFSMSMFDFSTSRGSSKPMITSNFWMYWVIVIPLTLIILGIWKVWMVFEGKDSKNENDSLQHEKNIAYQDALNANLDLNTPFYPNKGRPGHIFPLR